MQGNLVQQHLERVSGKLFEEFQSIISSHARGRTGIYVLYSGKKIYYVGLASNLNARLKQHLRDRHKGNWNTFSMYLTRNDKHIRELEALLHRVLLPSGNKQTGKLKQSQNLKKIIASQIKKEQGVKLKKLLGSPPTRTTKSRSKSKKISHKISYPLADYFSRAVQIRAWYKGDEYRGRVLASGKIRVGEESFKSPSAAGKYVCNRTVNGWYLWHYRNNDGEWVRLRELRK